MYLQAKLAVMKGGFIMGQTELLALVTELRGLRNMAAELADESTALEDVPKAENDCSRCRQTIHRRLQSYLHVIQQHSL